MIFYIHWMEELLHLHIMANTLLCVEWTFSCKQGPHLIDVYLLNIFRPFHMKANELEAFAIKSEKSCKTAQISGAVKKWLLPCILWCCQLEKGCWRCGVVS